MTTSTPAGSVYRLIVRSADEAVQTIRERFGMEAKVLSVRQVEGQGLSALFSRPKMEVVVQVGSPAPAVLANAPEPESPVEADPPTVGPAAQPNLPVQGEPLRRAGTKEIRLPDLLRRAGFSETMLARLDRLPVLAQSDERPLHVALADLGRELRRLAAARVVRPLPARTAFLGSCGVGRTTALCKWLSREVFTQGRSGRVFKVEFDQPNPAEDLAVFCEALGLSLEHATPGLDLTPPEGGFVYADLPGLAMHRPAANRELARFLDEGHFEGRVLVLNALYDHAALRAAYAAGRELGATHLVFTHGDELAHWGKLMDFLIDGELTPLFLGTGPSLSGDCVEAVFDAVLRKTLPGA